LHSAGERATELLTAHGEQLTRLAEALEEHEVLDEHEIEQLIGPSVNRRAQFNGRPVEIGPRGPKDSDIKPTTAGA
jgi:hypothetical protein